MYDLCEVDLSRDPKDSHPSPRKPLRLGDLSEDYASEVQVYLSSAKLVGDSPRRFHNEPTDALVPDNDWAGKELPNEHTLPVNREVVEGLSLGRKPPIEVNNDTREGGIDDPFISLVIKYYPSSIGADGKVSFLEHPENTEFLNPQTSTRYSPLPVKYPVMRDYYTRAKETFWIDNAEVDWSKERDDFAALPKGVQEHTKRVMGYFVTGDGIIMENIQMNFSREIGIMEARQFMAFKNGQESIHSDIYAQQAERIGLSEKDQNELFAAMETMPSVRAKAEWAKKYLSPHLPVSIRLVAESVLEGIFFTTNFGWVYWIEDRFPGRMLGLVASNKPISRDENSHVEFDIVVSNHLPIPVPTEIIREIYLSALKVEMIAVDEMASGEAIKGLSVDAMREHARYTANYWFRMFKDVKMDEVLAMNHDGSTPKPLPCVTRLSMASKVNIFEVKNPNYRHADMTNQTLDVTADF